MDRVVPDRPQEPRGTLDLGCVIAERCRICGVLGEGGSKLVYLAERLSDQCGAIHTEPGGDHATGAEPTRVALKVIHRHLLGDRPINRRFHRGARILSQLRCPHIARLIDFGETAALPLAPHARGPR